MSQKKQTAPRRLLKAIAKCIGLGVVAGALLPPGPAAAAQALAYRPSQGAPAAWQEFARLVKSRLQEWLALDDQSERRVRASFQAHTNTDGVAPTIIARIWIAADGKVERVEFDGLEAGDAVELRSILAHKEIGAPPPVGMMQPLHLKLSSPSKN